MQRRDFLQTGVSLSVAQFAGWARAANRESVPRQVVLIELRGGNDGLNTLVPIDDGRYYDLRPRLALRGDALVPLASGVALHASLKPWVALWNAGEMAILQGVGYPQPDLSHFRSIEIWDTASASNTVLQTGWLTRAAQSSRQFQACAADGVILGAADLGPLAGGARAVALANTEHFAHQSRLASARTAPTTGALAHIVQVENDIVQAGAAFEVGQEIRTEFPRTPFGQAARQAALIAAGRKVPVVRLALGGFDTHQNQLGVQAALLRQVAEAVVALRAALTEAGVWQETVVLTYSEFGRRPRENGSGGTDHGTANVHFAFGHGVRRGLYGAAPALDRLDGAGNLPFSLDFRSVYATILERWWRLDAERVLGGRHAPVPFIA